MSARQIVSVGTMTKQQWTVLLGAVAKRGRNSGWSTPQKTRQASFERSVSALSNDAGLVSRDVDHVELQPRFASAPTIAVNTREAISKMVRMSIVLIFRVPYFSGPDAAERGNFLWGGII